MRNLSRFLFRVVCTLARRVTGNCEACMCCGNPLDRERNRNQILRDRHRMCPPLKGRWPMGH